MKPVEPPAEARTARPQLRVDRDGAILVITVDNPPVNALSYAVRVALIDAIVQAQHDDSVAAVVLRCEGRSFISGADIKEFANPRNPRVPEMIEWVETSRKPVVAAVHGAALGGGLEIIMACHYRIAHAEATFGLPEVKIGLLPGAGGTQRLPRLVGFERALAVMIDGATLDTAEALASGLLDRVTQGDVHAEAIVYARELVQQGARPRRTSERQIAPADPSLLQRYRMRMQAECPGFRAPLDCIDSAEAAALPFNVGATREKTLFFGLFGSPQAKACQYGFFAQREVGRLPAHEGAPRAGIGIVLVGSGPQADRLATALAGAGEALRGLTEIQWDALTPQAMRALAQGGPWLIDATDRGIDARGRMLRTAAEAGVTVLSTVAPAAELAGLARTLPADAWLSGLAAPPRAGATLIETRAGPQGTAGLEPVHQAARRAGAMPMFLAIVGESLQARLLAKANADLRRIVASGTPAPAVAAALQAYGLDPATFGFPAPDQDAGTVEQRQAATDQWVAAAVAEAAALLAAGTCTKEQIDVAWMLGLGWPLYRGGPAWQAALAALPSRRS
jgi:enoyl-CoA hydratase/carnithine racemase